jgi:hypothetical protein
MTSRCRLRGDDGFAVTLFAVTLTAAMVLVCGLVVDGGAVLSARREAAAVAAEAARAGAQQLDLASARTGVATLDPSAARTAAESFASSAGFPAVTVAVDCDAVACRAVHVIVTGTAHLRILSAFGLHDPTVTGHGIARVARGRAAEEGG